MKRFVYAAGAVLLTGVLVLLAMAVAQRDSRVSDATTDESQLPYANNAAEPISMVAPDPSGKVYEGDETWPPAPIVRGNDPGLGGSLPPAVGAALPSTQGPSNELGLGGPPVSLTSFANESQAQDARALAEPPALSSINSFPPPNVPTSAPIDGSNSSPAGLLPPVGSRQPTNSLPPMPNAYANELTDQSAPLPNEPAVSPFASPALPLANAVPVANPTKTNPSLEAPKNEAPPIATFGAPTLIENSPSSNLPALPSYAAPSVTAPSVTAPMSTGQASSGPASTGASRSLPASPMPKNELPTYNATPQSDTLSPVAPPMSNSFSSNGYANAAAPNSTALNRTATESNWSSSAAPGGRQLDGSQNPSMEIQKRAPNEVQVGQPATFTILVRNVGTATAYDVNVVDSVPKGAKLVRTSPMAQSNGENGLVWKLGEMPVGKEQVLTLELIPETEGEIGSVASVSFAAQASVRTMSTQPKLVVKQLLEPVVLGGDSLRIMIEIANVGTGTARDVRLQEDVPENMRHATGSKALELTLGDLAPGESEKRDSELTAVSAGKVRNVLRAVSENAATSESASEIEVVLPKLDIAIEGAGLRYLERQVTYALQISNSGTAIARDVEILLYLPSGLQFNSTINQGAYLPSQHAVRWELAELAAGAKAVTEVTLLPVEEGNFVLRLQSQADGVRAETAQKPVRVEGQSELTFTIEDDNDPIETDGKTTYLVKISNIGTRVDKNVELAIDLPEGAIVEQVDAPVDYKVSQRNVVFAPISQIQAKDRHTIRLSVRHSREGTHVVRAQLKSQLRPVAVAKEESTQVYLDR